MKIDKKAIAGIKRYVRNLIKYNHNQLYGKEDLSDFWCVYIHNKNQSNEIVYDINIFGGDFGVKKDHVKAIVYPTNFDGKYYSTDFSQELDIGNFYCQETYFGWGLYVKGGHGLVLETWNKDKQDTLAIQQEWKAEFPSIETFVIETERGATQ